MDTSEIRFSYGQAHRIFSNEAGMHPKGLEGWGMITAVLNNVKRTRLNRTIRKSETQFKSPIINPLSTTANSLADRQFWRTIKFVKFHWDLNLGPLKGKAYNHQAIPQISASISKNLEGTENTVECHRKRKCQKVFPQQEQKLDRAPYM